MVLELKSLYPLAQGGPKAKVSKGGFTFQIKVVLASQNIRSYAKTKSKELIIKR